jgi:hypothetical protein
MPQVDIFKSDIFSMTSLTTAINKLPYQPMRLGELGLFEQAPVATTSVVVEERQGLLTLLQTKQRGAPANEGSAEKRKARSLVIPHIPYEDTVKPEDVQNIRVFGSEDQFEGVASVVNDRLARMLREHEVTQEHMRMGALQGNVLDADGSLIYDLFDFFGVTEQTEAFAFSNSATSIRDTCLKVHRKMRSALGGLLYTGVHCIAGKDFFSALIKHADVKTAYERFRDGEMLRNDPRSLFPFANINFEEYADIEVGGRKFIPDDEARFFPLGVPELFKTYLAPADFMETVNTLGLPFYAKSEPEKFDRGVRIHTQSNPLPICHRPNVLIKGTMS